MVSGQWCQQPHDSAKIKFKELNEDITGQVKFGDGSLVLIKGKGSISVKCKNGDERVLNDVYYIPSLCSNIISLGQMVNEGYKITINGEFLWVRDELGVLLMKVKRSMNRLYKFIIEIGGVNCLLSENHTQEWLWHSRLGHVNFNAMQELASKQMVHGLPKLQHLKDVCSGYLMSKQTRRSFPSKPDYSASRALELVHGDLCGPISPSTVAGNRYVFLLVDDFSRVMWAYLLKSKDETFDIFKKFKALVEDGKEKKIKTFRTDRGGEFCSREFLNFCE